MQEDGSIFSLYIDACIIYLTEFQNLKGKISNALNLQTVPISCDQLCIVYSGNLHPSYRNYRQSTMSFFQLFPLIYERDS